MAEQVDLDISLAGLINTLKQAQSELNKTGEAGVSALGPISDEIAQLAKEAEDLIAVQRQVNAELKKSEAATTSWAATIKNGILNTQVFGKSIGEWGGQLNGLIGKLTGGAEGASKMSKGFTALGNVIKLSPLGLLAGVIGSLIAYFTRFQSGIDKVAQVTAGLSATVTVLIERFLKVGDAIGKFFSGDFAGAANDIKASIAGIGAELLNAATGAAELEKRMQVLRDASRTASVESARQQVQLEAFKRIADDETLSIGKRDAARRSAAAIEVKLANESIDRALEAQQIAAGKFALDKESGAARDELATREIDLQGKIDEKNRIVFENEKLARELQQKAREASAKALKEEFDALLKIQKDLERLRVEAQPEGIDKELAAVQKRFDDLGKITADGIAKLNEISAKRQKSGRTLTPQEIQEQEELAQLQVALEERRTEALLDVLNKYAEKDIAIEEELAKGKEALKLKDLEAAKKSLETVKTLREGEIAITEENFKNFIALLEANGASKERIAEAQFQFDAQTKTARLTAELEFQKGLLDLVDAGDKDQVEQIKNKIALLQAQIDGIGLKPPKIKEDFDFRKVLGKALKIDPKDQKDFEKAIDASINAVQALSNAKLEAAKASVEAADKEVKASEDRVNSAKDALDTELEIAKLGFASNVTRRQEELAAAEQQEAAAKQQREKALEEQKKAQRAQILLDSALQISNLITAATSIYKGFSLIPIVGAPLGVAAVAFLLGSFIAAKAKAINALKAKEGITGRIGKDGIIVGPSHENNGVPLEVEGGEFTYQDGKRISVVKKSATAAHFDLLQAVNNDDMPGMRRYLEKITGMPRRDIQATNAAAANTIIIQSSGGTSQQGDKETHRLLQENNRIQNKIIKMEEDKVEYFDMGDYILKVKNGREERIKKSRP